MVIQAVACMAAACFFGMLLRQPKSTLVYTAVIGLIGFVVFIVMGGSLLAFFVSGLLVGILCEITARVKKKTTTLFLVSSIIPLVPGLGLYRFAILLAQEEYYSALRTAVDTLGGIGAIALAITLSTMLFSNMHFYQKPSAKGDLDASSDHK